MGSLKSCIVGLTVLAATTCLAAGCGGDSDSASDTGTPSGEPAASATPSPLQAALNGIRDDGTWSTDTALSVFAAAFGPLPGVDAPERDTSWKSGTLALRMVEAKWDDLSDAQRTAVRDYAGPSASSILPGDGGPQTGASWNPGAVVLSMTGDLRPGAPRPNLPAAETYQEIADRAAADISSRIGRALGIPIHIASAEKDDPSGAWAWASGNWGEVPEGSKPTACIITIPPSTNSPARAPYLRWVFLHEVWHCFESTLTDRATMATNPAWVTEGEAAWVAEAITGGAGAPPPEVEHWGQYINDPGKPLFARSYDAVGFYAQLVHNNIDPWTVLDKMVTAGGSDGALQLSGATANSFADRWGSSWFRDSKPNNDWAMTDGYGIPSVADRATPQSIEIADGAEGTVSAVRNSGGIASVHTTAFVTHIEVSGVGRIADEGGGLDKVIRAATLDLCTSPSGDCKCPEGSPNSRTPPDTAPSSFRAAVTGEQRNNSQMSLRGISKEEWCGQTPKPTPSPTATPGAAAADCGTLLPSSDVQQAVGINIGAPMNLAAADIRLTVFPVACVWQDVSWSLQGNPKDPPFKPKESQLAGLPCQKKGSTGTIIYCLNASSGNGVTAVGGTIYTSRWGFSLTMMNISIDQVASKIIPILDRTGN